MSFKWLVDCRDFLDHAVYYIQQFTFTNYDAKRIHSKALK